MGNKFIEKWERLMDPFAGARKERERDKRAMKRAVDKAMKEAEKYGEV